MYWWIEEGFYHLLVLVTKHLCSASLMIFFKQVETKLVFFQDPLSHSKELFSSCDSLIETEEVRNS